MKFARLSLMGLSVLLAPMGCSWAQKFRPQPDALEIPSTVPSAAELQERLQVATRIGSVNLRDNTLATLAREAAAAQQPELAKQALTGIVAVSQRDSAAADCALRLRHQGRTDWGVEIAELILSPSLRDQTLSRLAKGN